MRALWGEATALQRPLPHRALKSLHAARSHNDIARDILGVTAVIVLPVNTTTLVAAVTATVAALAPVGWMSVIVT
jgi:hypothetical protein